MIKHTYTHERFAKQKSTMSKTAAPQKSIAKEMTDAKLMIVKERNMPSHTKRKERIICQRQSTLNRDFS